MNNSNWFRVLASGVVWAAVYNLIWGLAWFLWMRREWLTATAASNHAMPWKEIWIIWGVFSLPLGIVAMAHIALGASHVSGERLHFVGICNLAAADVWAGDMGLASLGFISDNRFGLNGEPCRSPGRLARRRAEPRCPRTLAAADAYLNVIMPIKQRRV